MKSIVLPEDDMVFIKKQISLQKRGFWLFPFVALFFTSLSVNDFHGQLRFFMIFFSILYALFLFVYSPLIKGITLGKVIYSIDVLNEVSIEMTTFGTLWRYEKTIIADIVDIQIDKDPLAKLLYKKYALNAVQIQGEKYYIFNSILEESFGDRKHN